MKPMKKLLTTGFAVAALGIITVSFQNCSTSSVSEDSSSTTAIAATTGPLVYPVTSGITLTTGQSITLKVARPGAIADLSQYVWMAYYDGGSLVAKQGAITEANGYMYISLSVKNTLSAATSFRVYLVNYSTGAYLDGKGILLNLVPGAANPYVSDYINEACAFRSSYVPTFAVDKTKIASSAITIMENGAGIGTLICSIGGVDYDCLATSKWPSDWASKTMAITGYNRCSIGTTVTF